MKKIHGRQLTLQKYSCYDLKKNHARKLITKKNSCGSKIPHPPHNFSNGPSLTCKSVQSLQKQIKDRIELLIFLRYSMSCSCRISCRYSISCFKCLCKCHKNCNRPPLKKDEKRSSLAMFYKIYSDQTGIDTGKYLKLGVICIFAILIHISPA